MLQVPCTTIQPGFTPREDVGFIAIRKVTRKMARVALLHNACNVVYCTVPVVRFTCPVTQSVYIAQGEWWAALDP